jgi:phosphomannomutase
MNYPEEVFKKNDIRGKLDQITPELARTVGFSLAKMQNAEVMVVGRDMRKTSPEISDALIAGIRAAGVHVKDMGLVTTSLFNYAVSTLEVDAGCMVTASHNPSEYNGIKMATKEGLPIPGTDIYAHLIEEAAADTQGTLEEISVVGDYLDAVLGERNVPDVSNLSLVVDYGNGMGIVTLRPFFERLGMDVTELYPEPDADFPNHEANPAKEDTLVDLKAKVLEVGADIGIAIDGDGDRVGFIDDKGKSLRGDQVLTLLALEALKGGAGGNIITAPNMGWGIRDLVKGAGGACIDVPIGRTKVVRAVSEHSALVGGEISSHFMFPEFSSLESIDFAILSILALIKTSGKSLSQLTEHLHGYVNSGQINTEVGDKDAVIAAVKARYESEADVVNEMDGIRCEFGRDWWFLLRKSNTEPIVRLTVEAKSEELMREKVGELKEFLV